MICKKCGAEIDDNSLFCQKCGQKVEALPEKQCANCHAPLNAESKFCTVCGQKTEALPERMCEYCHAPLKAESKFCNFCGKSSSGNAQKPATAVQQTPAPATAAQQTPAPATAAQQTPAPATATKKRSYKWVWILAGALVLILAVYFVYVMIFGFDKQAVKDGYFEFLPEVTIGELLDATHKNPNSDAEPLWGETSDDDGDTVEFDGENKINGTKLVLHFAEGSDNKPEITYININGMLETSGVLEAYIEKVYAQYMGKDSADTSAVTETVTETQTETEPLTVTETQSETTVAETTTAEVAQMYPTDMMGKTVEELYRSFGEPIKVEACGLGGGANDMGYYYSGFIFYSLYDASIISENTPDFSGTINMIAIVNGSLNKNVRTGMTHNEISACMEISDYEHNDMDDNYSASADIICNGIKCSFTMTVDDSSPDIPCNKFTVYDNESPRKHVVSQTYGYIITEKDPLNVRKEPNTDSDILLKLDKGTRVKITGQSASGQWYEIDLSGMNVPQEYGTVYCGYVSAKYILLS